MHVSKSLFFIAGLAFQRNAKAGWLTLGGHVVGMILLKGIFYDNKNKIVFIKAIPKISSLALFFFFFLSLFTLFCFNAKMASCLY